MDTAMIFGSQATMKNCGEFVYWNSCIVMRALSGIRMKAGGEMK